MTSGRAQVALGDICEIVSGATPKTSDEALWSGGVPWATPKDLSDLDGAFIHSTPRTLSSAGLASCSATLLPVGSILLSSRAPIGHVAINTVPMATNQGFKSLVPKDDRVNPKFLYWWLRWQRPQIEAMGNGATFKEISKRTTAAIDLPLPPIEEQRRIAAVLDAADALRSKRRRAIAKLDTLTQAIFIDMFGDLANNPHAWPLRQIGDLVESFESGKSIATGEEDPSSEFRVLKVSAVTTGSYAPEASKPVPAGYLPSDHHLVRRRDLLFSRANTTELVGACAFVHETPSNRLLPDKLWRFIWKSDVRTEPLYVWRALQDRRAREQIEDLATGSSGSMKNISQQKFMKLVLPVPPVALQERFAQAFGSLQSTRSRREASLRQLDDLFASLQQRAFRGEL